ncbi:MAG: hypothetical protein KBD27_02170 [Candidatus Moranbacteria bacterium]|nr:hypothetical protein [Candidatus Moranbacteria bacterium]
MEFENGIKKDTEKTASQEAPPSRAVPHVEKPQEEPKHEASHLELAKGEMAQAEELVRLEGEAVQFQSTVETLGGDWSVGIGEQYVNDLALPATVQAETVQSTVARNEATRGSEGTQERKKEKPFDSVARIMEDRKALCIHFITGLSNDNNKTTGKESVNPDRLLDKDGKKKASRAALTQLKTLAGLNPSISTSIFADGHNFEASWYRGVSQQMGVILREGTCVGISSNDAATTSESVKKRSVKESLTEEQLAEVLSEDNERFNKSGYNEASISEPRIGALFLPTTGGVSREKLQALQGENAKYGYPIFLESGGSFFALTTKDIGTLLEKTGEVISVEDYLQEGKKVSRDDIRAGMAGLDSEELQAKEQARFDSYVEQYDLKPHFSWSEELATTVETQVAFHLAIEEQKMAEYKAKLAIESETDGTLTRRLHTYFTQRPETITAQTEIKYIYVNGELQEETSPEYLEATLAEIPGDAQVEVKTTKTWEYRTEIAFPSALTESVCGVGEKINIQKKRMIRMFVFQGTDGNFEYQTSEGTRLIVNKMNTKTGELVADYPVLEYLLTEKMAVTAGGMKKIDGGLKVNDTKHQHMPAVMHYHGSTEFVETPTAMREKIAQGKFREEKRKQVALHAKTLAEMYQQSGDEALAVEWQAIAESLAPDVNDRYAHIRSKLNQDGTLKLDKEDVAEL